MDLTIEEVKKQLDDEEREAKIEWEVARKLLTSKTKARAGVRKRIKQFDAQIKRAQDAALTKVVASEGETC